MKRYIEIEEVYKDKDGWILISSVSPFYPDGKGGQLGDRGEIKDAKVLKVWEKEGKVYHLVDKALDSGKYEVKIDEKRVLDIKQQHTAQHILSAAFIKVANIETVSFHMGESVSTIDLDVPILERFVMDEAEDLANNIVKSMIDVEEIIVTKEEVNKYPLRKALSEKVKGPVRLIKIADFDISPCGGYHVKNTGEIGIIKIVDKEKVKGKLTRIYFLAGNRALKDYRKRVYLLKNLTTMLTTSIDEIEKRIERLLDSIKEKSSIIEKISEDFAKLISEKLKVTETKAVPVIFYSGYDSVCRFLPKYVNLDRYLLITFNGEKYDFASQIVNCKKIVDKLKEKYGGKGGAGKSRGTYMGKINFENIKKILDEEFGG